MCWCGKRKPDSKIQGYHKYINMRICQDCFDKNGLLFHITLNSLW